MGLMRGKRARRNECIYGCCRDWPKTKRGFRAREKRQWKKEVK